MKGSARTEIVSLIPRGAFHLGERGIGLEETVLGIPSDTLYSAVCVAWSALYGEQEMVRVLLPPPDREPGWTPPLLISSAFPFAGPVRLYPRPMLPFVRGEDNGWRGLKDIAFVSEGILGRWLAGDPLDAPTERTLWQHGTVWLTEGESEALAAHLGTRPGGAALWGFSRVPRVALDVLSGASNIWHFGRVMFDPRVEAGYFILVRFLDQSVAERFSAAIRLLGDTGVGGDRSAGHGLFLPRFEQAAPGLPLDAGATSFVTLSLTYPSFRQIRDLFGDAARYRWTVRGGWIGGPLPTPYRRKTVRMICEGSVLTGNASGVWGEVADVTPHLPAQADPGLDRRVYRFGYAFPIGVPE
jgi:CRISPR-associated protein Csm4